MIWKQLVAGIALLAVAGSTAGYWLRLRDPQQELRLPGTVETQQVRLSSRVGGRVTKTFVKESEIVEPGQKIIELEMPELDSQRGQLVAQRQAAEAVLLRLSNGARDEEKAAAKAALDVAQATLARLQHGYRPEEIEQARQEMQALEADLLNSHQELERDRKLLAKGVLPQQQFEAADARHTKLMAQVNAASAKTQMFQSGYRAEEIAEAMAEVARLKASHDLLLAGTRPEEIAEAQAKVADLSAKIDEIDVKRNERVVTAPEKAVVEVLSVRPGDTVAANQTVAIVLRADDLWVKAYVSEVNLGRIHAGQRVKVTSDTYPDERFDGVVSHIASASEFTPRNVQTIDERRHLVFAFKVRVTDPHGVFKSGLTADVWVPLDKLDARSVQSDK
jgi:multidrug resistance efflux pump